MPDILDEIQQRAEANTSGGPVQPFMYVQPGLPLAFVVAPMPVTAHLDDGTERVLQHVRVAVETVHGSTHYLLEPDHARRLAEQLVNAAEQAGTTPMLDIARADSLAQLDEARRRLERR